MTLRTSELIKKSKEDIERGKGSRRNGHPCQIQRKERRGPNSIGHNGQSQEEKEEWKGHCHGRKEEKEKGNGHSTEEKKRGIDRII